MIKRTEAEITKSWSKEWDTPLVSICIFSYNHESFISEALDSFLVQETDFPFEIIIDDDCSTDETQNIIRTYMKRYPTLINANLRDENVGIVSNEISSLKRSRGVYIAICEGDDSWTDSNKLQYQIEQMKQHETCNISFHPVRLDYDDTLPKAFIENYIEKSQDILFQEGDHYLFSNYSDLSTIFNTETIIEKGGGFIATSSIILKREIIDQYADFIEMEVGKVEGKFIDYYLQILGSVNAGALFLPKAMSTYRLHTQGVWTSMLIKEDDKSLNKAESGMISVLSAIDKLLDFNYHEIFKSVISAILTKVTSRERTPIQERMEIVKHYRQLLSTDQNLYFQQFLMDELLQSPNDLTKIHLSTNQVDRLRDVALALEKLNLHYAHDLMEIAYLARPGGDYIKEKLDEYKQNLNPSPEQHKQSHS